MKQSVAVAVDNDEIRLKVIGLLAAMGITPSRSGSSNELWSCDLARELAILQIDGDLQRHRDAGAAIVSKWGAVRLPIVTLVSPNVMDASISVGRWQLDDAGVLSVVVLLGQDDTLPLLERVIRRILDSWPE